MKLKAFEFEWDSVCVCELRFLSIVDVYKVVNYLRPIWLAVREIFNEFFKSHHTILRDRSKGEAEQDWTWTFFDDVMQHISTIHLISFQVKLNYAHSFDASNIHLKASIPEMHLVWLKKQEAMNS